MCLTLYIGSDVPFELDSIEGEERRIALVAADRTPQELADKRHLAMIVDVADGRTYCSCAFQELSVSWEQVEEEPETLSAFDRLRSIVTGLMDQGDQPVVFACWTDMEDEPPALSWSLAPSQVRPGFGLFRGGELMPGGLPADTYRLDFDIAVTAPEHRLSHV